MTVADSERLKREILLRTMFPSMPVAAHVRFIELLDEITVPPGEMLFNQGDPPDRFLFLIEGRVTMEREASRAWEFVPLAVVGVIDAVLDRPRTRSCRALEPSRFLSLKMTDWFDMLEDNGQVARAAIRNFAMQLHGRWRKLAPRLPRASDTPPSLVPPGLETYDKILVLRRAASLRSAGMQAIASLATVAEPVVLKQGETLFEPGAQADNLYFVVRGAIELTADEGFRYLHPRGDLVGGPAALCHALPEYRARATTDTVLLRVAEQDFYDQAEEHGRLTRGTLKYLVSELEPLLEIDEAVSAPVKTLEVSPGA
ncbi:MAG TPA: cyclic nucleotide-binding domain-containing protein [Polyangiaceae bacterium]|nr:cyclic nucleotide-binding domain-containing protein [Polyangiaceae bacterium]